MGAGLIKNVQHLRVCMCQKWYFIRIERERMIEECSGRDVPLVDVIPKLITETQK